MGGALIRIEEVGESQLRNTQANEKVGVSHQKLRMKALLLTTGKYTRTTIDHALGHSASL